jgi:hypothetical protein
MSNSFILSCNTESVLNLYRKKIYFILNKCCKFSKYITVNWTSCICLKIPISACRVTVLRHSCYEMLKSEQEKTCSLQRTIEGHIKFDSSVWCNISWYLHYVFKKNHFKKLVSAIFNLSCILIQMKTIYSCPLYGYKLVIYIIWSFHWRIHNFWSRMPSFRYEHINCWERKKVLKTKHYFKVPSPKRQRIFFFRLQMKGHRGGLHPLYTSRWD